MKEIKKTAGFSSPGAVYNLPDLWSKKSYHRPPQYVPNKAVVARRRKVKKTKEKKASNPMLEFDIDLSPSSRKKLESMKASEVKAFIEMKKELRTKEARELRRLVV